MSEIKWRLRMQIEANQGRPRGGAFHCCKGRPMSGAPPPPTARPLGGLLRSATRVLWARVCRCGGPTLSPWPARPVGAACRGDGGGPFRGGWPATVLRGVRCQALSLPRLPVLWGGQPGYRDPCVPGAVGAGVGPSTGPTACALAGRRCSLWGWRRGPSRGGVPSTVARGVRCQALPLPRLPAHWAGCWGPLPTCCGRGRVDVGA